MDELSGLFWLIIIFLWFFFSVFKKKLPPLPKEGPQPQEPEREPGDFWETLGFPFPSQTPKPKPKIITKTEKIKILEKPKIEELPPIQKKEEPVVKKEEFIFSQDKLQEGIILSIILGPPKAYRLLTSSRITTAK